jgi:hypothetical protein
MILFLPSLLTEAMAKTEHGTGLHVQIMGYMSAKVSGHYSRSSPVCTHEVRAASSFVCGVDDKCLHVRVA